MKLYISGAMSDLPDYNRPAFDAAAAALAALGHDVFNPANNYKDGFTREDYLAEDVAYILLCDGLDGVVRLPMWEVSTGSQLEQAAARARGIDVLDLTDVLADGEQEAVEREQQSTDG